MLKNSTHGRTDRTVYNSPLFRAKAAAGTDNIFYQYIKLISL